MAAEMLEERKLPIHVTIQITVLSIWKSEDHVTLVNYLRSFQERGYH